MSVASYHEEFPNLLAMEKSDRSDGKRRSKLQRRLKRFSTDSPKEPPKRKNSYIASLFINN
jgi:hypothetical protein